MAETFSRRQRIGAIRSLLSAVPSISDFAPTKSAIARAQELGEKEVVASLKRFASMPESTAIIANPPLYRTDVECAGDHVTLSVRSFSIRGLVPEHEIVNETISPVSLIFVGLFARRPGQAAGFSEEAVLGELIERSFYRRLALERPGGLFERVVEFVHRYPGLGPELAIQYFAAVRLAERTVAGLRIRGINDKRRSGTLLLDFISAHMRNVAIGGVSMYVNHLLRANPGASSAELIDRTRELIVSERAAGRDAFEVSYSLLLGRRAADFERRVLRRMGTIQMHHGSAGSNMVARYLTTLHTNAVSNFFIAAQMTMDSDRHFGAIHDMTAFIRRLEPLSLEEVRQQIRGELLGGGLPTFGHPEIAAAGRGTAIEQDPRAAIYLGPIFDAIDHGELALNDRQRHRLALMQEIYRVALIEGVVKPGREGQEPLRLTPNTDYGAWSVQEALGIADTDRTFLTYIFRGFGWMMDAREQLLQKIIRPVIAPDPQIVPKDDGDLTIPRAVVRLHERMSRSTHGFEA